jgi:mRNA interferase MazF
MDIRRGEIYLVNLDPIVGSEIGKSRPALIIQNDVGNQYSPVTIVAPVTSQEANKKYPTDVWITAHESGLEKNSRVLLNQIRTVDKTRIHRKIGKLSAERMQEVNQAIRASLALD